MNLLLILAIVFGVLVLVRIANVAQMASELSGTSEEKNGKNQQMEQSGLPALYAGVLCRCYLYNHQVGKVNASRRAASEHGADVDNFEY